MKSIKKDLINQYADKETLNKSIEILRQIELSYSGTININGQIRKISALNLLGAQGYLYDKNSIQFAVKGSKRINKIVIKLNSMDTYDIEFWFIKMTDQEPYLITNKVKELNDIYNSQLGDLIVNEVINK